MYLQMLGRRGTMEYKIMLVEDEHMVLRYNRRIIERNTEDFIIVAEVENGEDALKYLQNNHVDLVLTDVKMPVMDGVELIRNLKEKYPGILSVVLSGYQDFQYVRECMQLGSEDYLLKPLKDTVVAETLIAVKKKLDIVYYHALEQEFGAYVRDRQISDGFSGWLRENGKEYFLIVLRSGYLSTGGHGGEYLQNNSPKVFEKLKEWNLGTYYICDGRFENEKILMIKKQAFAKFRQAMEEYSGQRKGVSYFTVIYDALTVYPEYLEELILKLYHVMDRHIIVGKTSIFHCGSFEEKSYIGIDSRMRGRLIATLKGQQWEEFKNELILLFEQWEKGDVPLKWMNRCIVEILSLVAGNASIKKDNFLQEAIEQTEELYIYARSISDILFGLCDYLADFLNNKSNYRVESRKLFLDIKDYIYKNIGENIRLRDITDNFYISQTYVNRLFRKYSDTSFYNFVLEYKIQEAQKIYEKSPQILTKDVALMLGFSDSGYFSKVFKSRTNLSPSEYVKKFHT